MASGKSHSARDQNLGFACSLALCARKNQEKKTPLRSRPSTEIKFALGSGGMSDSNRKPACSADQLIVAPVLKKLPLNIWVLFSISVGARAPFHSTSKETFARTANIPGMAGEGGMAAGLA